MAAIEVHNLISSYGSFVAVRGVDLSVEQGTLFALLGTNGAGKTTTLETIEGHRPPTSGDVRVLGGAPRAAAVRRRMGIMLQESGFAGDLTVAETLDVWRTVAGRTDRHRELLESVDLGHRSDVLVVQLSGGERRRLDFALAIYGQPDVIVLDEPTTGLDPESRARIWELVKERLRCGATVLLTTHYLEEAEAHADRIAIMHRGRVAVEGRVDDLLARHAPRVSFTLPEAIAVADLPSLSKAPSLEGRQVNLDSRDLQDDLHALLLWANARQVRLDRLAVREASLAWVFDEVADSPAVLEERWAA